MQENQTIGNDCEKRKAIEQLYRSKEFNDCINKMEPDHLRDDLRAEVMVILLETPDEKFAGIRNLRYYAARIIIQLIQSNTSPFYKKYRYPTTHVIPEIINKELNGRIVREHQEESIKEYINNLYWYDKAIINLYLKLGSYRAIEKETGIPWESCYATVRKVIKKIRRDVLSATE